MFVVNGKGELRVPGFTFNGMGTKFPPYKDDALLKARSCKFSTKHRWTPLSPNTRGFPHNGWSVSAEYAKGFASA